MYKCSKYNKAIIHQQEMKDIEGCIFRALAQLVQLQKMTSVTAFSAVHWAQVRGPAWACVAGVLLVNYT